jgi:hypothetical protein
MMTIFTDTVESDPKRYEWLWGKAPCPYPLPDPDAPAEAQDAAPGPADAGDTPAEAADGEPAGHSCDDSCAVAPGWDDNEPPEPTAEVPAAALAEHAPEGAQ